MELFKGLLAHPRKMLCFASKMDLLSLVLKVFLE